jgi:S1-C subfamily serine protease
MWAVAVLSALSLVPAADPPEKPYLGFRYAEQRKSAEVVITNVDSKGLAAQFGLRPDDVFQSMNGKKIRTEKDLQDSLNKLTERVEIIVFRPSMKSSVELRGLIKKGTGPDGKMNYHFLPTDKDWKVDFGKIEIPKRSRPDK